VKTGGDKCCDPRRQNSTAESAACQLLWLILKQLYLGFGSISFSGIISQKLFDQVNVCHDHSAAAIALAPELIHSVSIGDTLVKKL
jgi:hypothetical protein